jgi:hypothetical protein
MTCALLGVVISLNMEFLVNIFQTLPVIFVLFQIPSLFFILELTRMRAQHIVYRKGNSVFSFISLLYLLFLGNTRHCIGECLAHICDAVVQV